ncbi:MAG: class I SAM-dependent methyltransferase [Candidatus Omnitrophica bacterium]|nr:class I SAM-dependent methyltransferase [Candidatus Omnitrophota bacterium]
MLRELTHRASARRRSRYVDFVSAVHTRTRRDYLRERVIGVDKAACATIAKQFGRDYWDGERQYGYGGYTYDGRWRPVAEQMAAYYRLKPGDRILDVGCGKGYLLYEFTQVLPGARVAGLDISAYAIAHAKPEIKPFLRRGQAVKLPYPDRSFDLVMSINVLHNLHNYELRRALQEVERVGKRHTCVVVDSYRNEREKVNLLYWQLTCETFYTPKEWEWFFKESGYTGDYGFVFYE